MLTSTNLSNWKDLPGMWRLFSLRSKVRDSFQRTITFAWPLYDLRYYFSNLKARKLYRLQKDYLTLTPLQKQIIRDLGEKGLSVIHVNELFPEKVFRELQDLAEALIHSPANQMGIKGLRSGTQRVLGSEKFYLVRLLGDQPVLSSRDRFLNFSLSDEVLGIACSYLGMFCRLSSLNVWCNIPTDGPDRYSQRWHRDPDDKKQVKLFLYLQDVDQTTGPFCYIRGTHATGPFRKIYPQTIDVSHYPPDGAVEKAFSENQKFACVGKAGTLIFCDTTGFHKGGHPLTGPRLLLNGVYMSNAGALLNEKRFGKQYLMSDSGTELGPLAKYAIGLQKN